MKITTKTKRAISGSRPSVNAKRPSSRLEQLLSILPFGLRNNKPVVAVLRLEGVIGKVRSIKPGLNLSALNELIEKMFKLERLDSVCLVINSPGGSPVQSELICKRVRLLAEELDVPVYSFVEDVAASGGYWLACAGDKIFASQSSIIGSIGVISSGFGFCEAIGKLGVERRIITEGRNKSVLDPFLPVKTSDVNLIKKLQKNIYHHFTDSVKERRSGRLTQSDEFLFTGEFWTGQQALDYGLIDGIDDLYSFLQKRYGDDVKVEYIEPKQSWFKRKFGMASSATAGIGQEVTESIIELAEARMVEDRFKLY